MTKQAFWRGKGAGPQTTRYALYAVIGSKTRELKQFGGYSAWDNPRAEEQAEEIAKSIEEAAKQIGYVIVENPID